MCSIITNHRQRENISDASYLALRKAQHHNEKKHKKDLPFQHIKVHSRKAMIKPCPSISHKISSHTSQQSEPLDKDIHHINTPTQTQASPQKYDKSF